MSELPEPNMVNTQFIIISKYVSWIMFSYPPPTPKEQTKVITNAIVGQNIHPASHTTHMFI